MTSFGYTGQDSFIKDVVLAPTVEKERCLIADQLADLRTLIKDCNDKNRALVIARLVYLNVRGENTNFGQAEVLRLISVSNFSLKRIGYIGAQILLDAKNDMAVLLPQTVCKDLSSTNPIHQALALNLVANLANADLCKAAGPAIMHLIDSPLAQIQKRAGMAALSSVRVDNDSIETFRPAVAKLLNSASHCVVTSGINLAIEILKYNPSISQSWKGFIIPFTKILKTLCEVKAGREFDFNTFNDPFLQIKILKCLSLIKNSSEELDDLLTSLVTSLDCRRNTARGILLQAVETISICAKKPSLRGLAINQIGRLFTFKTALVYYTALSAFSRFLFTDGSILDRGSADSQALQRYKSQIVQCLDHPDPSIRRRALDVISALINEDNITTLFPEIMTYMKLVDTDFKSEIVPKLFTAIQRFAPSMDWNFDSVLRLMTECESYISNDIIISFCTIISKNVEKRDIILQQLQNILVSFSTNQPIVQTAAWVLGEFQNEDTSSIEAMEKILKLPQTSTETRCYLITALSKMAMRFNLISSIGPFLVDFQTANNIEIQQRAGEMVRILAKPALAAQVLSPIELTGGSIDSPKAPESQPEENLLDSAPPKASEPADILDDDLLGLSLPSPKPAQGQSQKAEAPIAQNQDQSKAEAPQQKMVVPPGAVEALKTSDYVVYFEIQRNNGNPNQLAIRVTTYGLSSVTLTNFLMQFGVPLGWIIAAKPPSGNVLEANGTKPIQQVLLLENRGTIPLIMRTQTSYMYRTQPIKEMGQINQIF